MLTFALAESAVTNSIGRAISLSLVAAEFGDVELWAVDDGPTWTGARHFDLTVHRFSAHRLDTVIDRIRDAARTQPVLVWISKGLSPLDRIARAVAGTRGVTIVADFDDDDVSLMQEQVRKSLKTALHLNVLHRKSPLQVARAQRRTAAAASSYTFSSDALRRTYQERELPARPSAVVAHARPASWLAPARSTRRPGPLRLAYLGTVRPHKGADRILALVEAMPDIEFSSFSGSFRPAGGGATWHAIGPEASLPDVYADIDFTLVPQDPRSSAAQNQLPSKIVEAAAFGVADVATPTPVIEEYCAGSYIPVHDWSDPRAVAASIREADPVALGAAMRRVFVDRFATEVSGGAVEQLLHSTRTRRSQPA
jgi:glycosyltransferase involved in cell wall biosynthesis